LPCSKPSYDRLRIGRNSERSHRSRLNGWRRILLEYKYRHRFFYWFQLRYRLFHRLPQYRHRLFYRIRLEFRYKLFYWLRFQFRHRLRQRQFSQRALRTGA
jgi:hypothetical protein